MTDRSVGLEVILFGYRFSSSEFVGLALFMAGIGGIGGIGGISGRKSYCPSDLPLRSIPPRLTARCLPLTAAGGQGPQDNVSCDQASQAIPGGPLSQPVLSSPS